MFFNKSKNNRFHSHSQKKDFHKQRPSLSVMPSFLAKLNCPKDSQKAKSKSNYDSSAIKLGNFVPMAQI